MAHQVGQWDLIPVYGVYMTAPGDAPVQGNVQFKLSQRITRTDGRTIYPDGAKVQVTIGAADQQDASVRAAVRTAWRAADQATLGGEFDGSAWDVWWDTYVLPAAIFTGFPASDDPDISQRDWTVTVKEALTGATGREYAIRPLLAQLGATIPGINLGTVEVPPGSPSVSAPVYAKGVAGGIAALDADGDVVDADGVKVTGGGGLPEGSTLADLSETPMVKHFTSTEQEKLAGIAAGATVNDTDSNLKSRANHTGTQAVSTVTGLQAALDGKAPLASPTFTGTVSGVTKDHVGLGSVDNTSDLAKPVSTATQVALDGKADASHVHSTANVTGLDAALAAKAPLASPAFTGTPTGITKAHVGLGSVDNTADSAKPISTATQTALNGKAATSHTHTTANVTGLDAALAAKAPLASPAFTGTVTGVTKAHVGLGNVDNTADSAKPVSTAQAAAIGAKVGSPNSTVTGVTLYPTVGDLPATGTAGVLYFVDSVG